MAMSGVEVDPEINTLFNDIKTRKTNKWATFKIENKKKITVAEVGEKCTTDNKDDDKVQFDIMKAALGKEPQYILYDFGFTLKDGRKINKLAFIFWCDDNNAKIGDKMIYASSKDSIKKAFVGIGLEFQANDSGEMDYTTFSDEVERKA